MSAHAHVRGWIASLLIASFSIAHVTTVRAQDTATKPPSETTPPAASTPVPAPPGNYAVPPPPAARYPAAPDLTPPELEGAPVDAQPQLRIPADIATRLRVLSTDLNTLAARGGGGVADGIFSIVTGGVLITLGVIFDGQSDLKFLAPQMYVFGGASIGRGLIDLIVVPNPYTVMLEYSHMPMTSVADVKARLRLGESGLEELADRNRLARLLDGAVSLGAGATLVGLTISANNSDNPAIEASNRTVLLVMGLLGATTLAIGGVISLLSSSDAERRWDAYQGLKDRLGRERALQRERRTSATNVTTAHITPVFTNRAALGVFTLRF